MRAPVRAITVISQQSLLRILCARVSDCNNGLISCYCCAMKGQTRNQLFYG